MHVRFTRMHLSDTMQCWAFSCIFAGMRTWPTLCMSSWVNLSLHGLLTVTVAGMIKFRGLVIVNSSLHGNNATRNETVYTCATFPA